MELYLDNNNRRGRIDYYGRVRKEGKDFNFTLTQVGSSLYMDFWPFEDLGHSLVEAISQILGPPKEGPTKRVLPSQCGKGVEVMATGWEMASADVQETEKAIIKKIKELGNNE
ncbi:MAG: hypothetical protein DRI92_03045 [Aquificota bacterium]|nr:MAG: hypothetical protein DRI91_06915 [Aquificota bacterium]RLD98983.1 MAG: hypothetical protein DRI92_03045 [Aquificota bacterium]